MGLPPPASTPDWEIAGAAFAQLVLTRRQWTHQRDEIVAFSDQNVVRRRVRIEFTLPDAPAPMRAGEQPLLLVPVARLLKHTLPNRDLLDEAGCVVGMLTGDQLLLLTASCLHRTVRADPDFGGGMGEEEELERACRAVVASHPAHADRALEELFSLGVSQRSAAGHLASALAESFFLVAVLPAVPGRRHTLRFSYDEVVGDPPSGGCQQFLQTAALRSRAIRLPIYGMNDVPSFHMEIEAPPGLWITRRELLVTGKRTLRRMGPYARARFDAKPEALALGEARIDLRPQASAGISVAAGVSWLAFAILFGFFVVLWRGGLQSGGSAATSVLLVPPTMVWALLVHPGEHAMTKDMLRGVRLLALMASGFALVGGGAFAMMPHRSPTMLPLFGALAVGAYFSSFALTLAWRICKF